jgi:flavin reductase (DIM6/NTAB) family NADH-FMN oxidoreductase RutF
MREITFLEALEKTAPQPVSVICVETPNGGTNLTPVAWWTFLESEPPMIGFSLAKESYSCALASTDGKVAICLPGESIADEVLKCGSVSGRDVEKVKDFRIELAGEDVKYPAESKLVYISTVAQKVIVGDCVFFICNVGEILCDDTKRHIYTWGHSESLKPIPGRGR